jgi:WD40 repeat protein
LNPYDGSLIYNLTEHTSTIWSLAAFPNGNLASGAYGSDYSIIVWNLKDGTILPKLTGHSGSIDALLVLPDGSLASGSRDKTIKIWNPNNGALRYTLTGHSADVRVLKLLPGGYLASGSFDKTIKTWDSYNEYKLKQTLSTSFNSGPINFLIVLSDGKIASSNSGGYIHIWA